MNASSFAELDIHQTRKQRLLLWLIVILVVIFGIWAYYAELDEVAIGDGVVIPASKAKIIQSLEGGILSELNVREGDIVQHAEKLATLDPIQARSSVEETTVRIRALQARAARLEAEMANLSHISFPPEVALDPSIVERERQLFLANREAFLKNVSNMQHQVRLAEKELRLAEPLLRSGASNETEVLRLRQKHAELSTKLSSQQSEYIVALKADYAKTMADLEPLMKVQEGRADQLRRTIINSPTHGIVKDIRVTTIGGVIPPGGVLMEIVPKEDQLLIETHLSPRDIAFIRPGQEAMVKITAYDSSIYGTLQGKVDRISPDTIEDPIDRRIRYYRAYVLTEHNYLQTADGKQHPIMLGMIVSTEIRTGRKTVLDYLLKPLNRANEALRER